MDELTREFGELLKRLLVFGIDKETVIEIRKFFQNNFDDVNYWLQLAFYLRQSKNFDAPHEVYDTALRLFPDSANLWSNRGILLRDYGHLEKAISSFEKAIQLQPSYFHAIESLAISYEKLGDYKTSSKYYKQALKLDNDSVLCWNNLGNCYRFQGLLQEAKKYYRKALSKDPQYNDSLFNLASIQYELKDYKNALLTLERYSELNPEDTSIKILRSKILKKPDIPEQIQKQPIHGSGYTIHLSTNIDENGNIIKPDLTTSKLVFSSDDILKMSREDAARLVGTKTWDRMHLRSLVQKEVDKNEPIPKNPLVPFISYRWGEDSHSEWVNNFVRDLEDRGYDVIYDKYEERKGNPPTVPELIARMTKCNLFVPMLTNKYTKRVLVSPDTYSPIDDGWVWDEWEIAKILAHQNWLRFIGIWVSGDDLPPPFIKKMFTIFVMRKATLHK